MAGRRSDKNKKAKEIARRLRAAYSSHKGKWLIPEAAHGYMRQTDGDMQN